MLPYLHLFSYATKWSIRDVAAASVKKRHLKKKIQISDDTLITEASEFNNRQALPYLLFSFTSAYYEFGVAHNRKPLKGLPFWDVLLR